MKGTLKIVKDFRHVHELFQRLFGQKRLKPQNAHMNNCSSK